MSVEARTELKRLLGPDVDLLRALSDKEAVALHALIEAARERQRTALRDAQQHALRLVPAILRTPLLKLLGAS